MPIIKRNYEDIFNDSKQYFEGTGSDGASIPGTPEHAIVSIVASEVSGLYNAIELAYKGLVPSMATAFDLDRVAELVGIERAAGATPYDDSLTNVKFYVDPDSGKTADDLAAEIGQPNLTIPKGTEISNGQNITYYVTEDATFATGAQTVFVKVRAYGEGDHYNVNANELRFHNLNAHPTLGKIANQLFVTNVFPIVNGRTVESDESLRFRITQAFASRAKANNAALLEAARNVPGVRDAFIIPNIYGSGTVGVYIESSSPIVSSGLINAVQAALDSTVAAGITAYVLHPDYISLRIEFEIVYDPTPNIQQLEDSIARAVVDYVNNLSRGSTIFVNKLIGVVTQFSGVKNAIIKTLKSGEYNPATNSIENEINLLKVDQAIQPNQKWFTSTDLITFCRVG